MQTRADTIITEAMYTDPQLPKRFVEESSRTEYDHI